MTIARKTKLDMSQRIAQLEADLMTAQNTIHYLSSSVETAVGQIEADAILIEGLQTENADLKAAARELVAKHTPQQPVRRERTAQQVLETVLRAGDNRVRVGDTLYVAEINGKQAKSGAVTFYLSDTGEGKLPQSVIEKLVVAV